MNTYHSTQSIQIVEKPWGREEIWANTDSYAGKILYINESQCLSYQYHNVKEETIYLLEGDLLVEHEMDGRRQKTSLKPGQAFHIPPKMKHRFIAVKTCKLLEVSTAHLDDVVRLEDKYGRVDSK